MAHPTRTGDLVAFAYPPYQFDAATPGTLVATSHFFGQHGYVPDVQDLGRNINMRATFLAGGEGIAAGPGECPVDRPGADAGVPARRPDAAAQPGRGAADVVRTAVSATAGLDRGAQRLPRPARPDDSAVRQRQNARVGGAAFLGTMFDEEAAGAAGSGADPGRRRQRRRVSGELLAARGPAGDRRRERLGPGRHVLRQPRVRLRRRAAAEPSGAGRLPVPGDQHRRRGHRTTAAVGDAVEGVLGQRGPGRGHRRRAPGDAGAGLGRRHRGPGVPRRGARGSARSPSGCGGSGSGCRSW